MCSAAVGSLELPKIPGPYRAGEEIVGADYFGFGGTFCVELLFGRFTHDCSTPERNNTASMTLHVTMDSIRGVYP